MKILQILEKEVNFRDLRKNYNIFVRKNNNILDLKGHITNFEKGVKQLFYPKESLPGHLLPSLVAIK